MKLRHFEGVGGKRDQYQIDPRRLKVRPDFNIRDLSTPSAREKLDVLKAQVKAEGVLEALEIEFDGETPWINEGHRRHMVVMELIEEGHDFKTVPCIQERGGLQPDKRTLHMLMRSKQDYEPLEYAKGVARMVEVYGWDKGELATHLGFKSKASIESYLEMVAMPDAVKAEVASGTASATTANKLMKNLPKGTDPELAAQILKDAAEEKRKLTGNRRATPKAVAREVERRKPKVAEELKSEPAARPFVAEVETETPAQATPPTPPVHTQLQTASQRESGKVFPYASVKIDAILTTLISCDVTMLARKYAQVCGEREASASDGSATPAQEQLCVAADVIGALRFPDDWEQTKANNELAQVA